MKLSVIIPVFNEENTVAETIDRVLAVPLPEGTGREIIVVNDGSTDATAVRLKKFDSHRDVKIYSLEKNGGKAGAVMLGLRGSSGEIILIQDADLEYCPESYPALLDPILNNGADIVYGSRFMGSITGMTLVNRLANRVSTLTLNALFHTSMTDMHTCLKVFRRPVLEVLTIRSPGFAFDTEVTCEALKAGYAVTERPIDYAARSKKQGKKITWVNALAAFGVLFRCKYQNPRRTKIKAPPPGGRIRSSV